MRQSKTHCAIALHCTGKDQLCKHCSLTKHLFRVHVASNFFKKNHVVLTQCVDLKRSKFQTTVAIAMVTAKTFVLRMFRLKTFLPLLTLD